MFQYTPLNKIEWKTNPILPTVYTEELSYLEIVNKLVHYVNTNNQNVDNMVNFINDFVGNFNEGLKQQITEILTKWSQDGILSELINSILQNKYDEIVRIYDEKIENIKTEQTAKNEVFVSDISKIKNDINNINTSSAEMGNKINQTDEKINQAKNEISSRIEGLNSELNNKVDKLSVNSLEFIGKINEKIEPLYNHDNLIVNTSNEIFNIDEGNYQVEIDEVDGKRCKIITNSSQTTYLNVFLAKAPLSVLSLDIWVKDVNSDNSQLQFLFMHGDGEISTINITNTIKKYSVNIKPPKDRATHIFYIILQPQQKIAIEKIIAYEKSEVENLYKLSNYNNYLYVNNTIGAINNIIDIAKTYRKNLNNLIYFNDKTNLDFNPATHNNKIPQDCSSFIVNLLKGITYDNQHQFKQKNIVNPNNYIFFNKKVRYTTQIAYFAYENNLFYKISDDYDNMNIGDIIFYCDPQQNRHFLNISHIAIYLGKNNDDKFMLIHYHNSNPNIFEIRNMNYMKNFKYGARLQLNDFYNVPVLEKNIPSVTMTNTSKVYEITNTLEKGNFYTLVIENFNKNNTDNYLSLGANNGTNYVTVFSDYMPIKEDGKKIFRFYINDEDNVNKLTLHKNGNDTGDIVCKNIKLYKGFYM